MPLLFFGTILILCWGAGMSGCIGCNVDVLEEITNTDSSAMDEVITETNSEAMSEGWLDAGDSDGETPERVTDIPVPESLGEFLPGQCDAQADLLCSHCLMRHYEGERVILIQQQFALVQHKERVRLIDLETCREQTFEAVGEGTIALAIGDPDSTRVLLVGYLIREKILVLEAAIFDLHTRQKLAEMQIEQVALRRHHAWASQSKRGWLALQNISKEPKPDRYIRFQLDQPSLVELTLPEHCELVSAQYHRYFQDVELYQLKREQDGQISFPVALWSIREQSFVYTIANDLTSLPAATFATDKHIVILQRKARVVSEFELFAYPLEKPQDRIILEAPSCYHLLANRNARWLLCLGSDQIYRFDYTSLKPLSGITLHPKANLLARWQNSLFMHQIDQADILHKIDVAADKPQWQKLQSPAPIDGYALGPDYPLNQSQLEDQAFSYVILRSTPDLGQQQQQLIVFDMQTEQFRLIADKLPEPAAIGRITEFFRFYRDSFSYSLEPTQSDLSPVTYLIRNDKGQVYAQITGLPDTTQIAIRAHRLQIFSPFDYASTIPNIAYVVDHRTHKMQSFTLSGRYAIYHNDLFALFVPIIASATPPPPDWYLVCKNPNP